MSDRESHGSAGIPPTAVPGPVDLNLLRTFLAVHRTSSFTAAAHLLGLSQPTVTTQIRALERRLGRELFERGARGVMPVPFADELAVRVVEPLDALSAVTGGPNTEGLTEPVHLAGPAELLCARVLPALAPLVARGVRLRVTTGLTDPLLAALVAGRHDLVIATSRPTGRTLRAQPLMDEEFVLVAAPAWAERITGDLPEALDPLPLLSYAEDLPIARRYWRHVFGRRLNSRAAVTVADLRGVLAAVTAGAGFSVLPRYLCQDELASGALVLLHRPEDPPINTGYLVQRPGPSPNPHHVLVHDELLRAARDW
ncbi:LysR family transcriptional regulator [Streptacidiphilus sp. P02-A3a]|uniref:LysR family transcriptional regulator n=1 Tax=Streptacidiphilus sp. P02-A3a TaxID=2704468 RepID=UPI0015FC15A8|nr:LysR family transcriptional regulator [Streptacidiphilus sp. P02-A3a]QMU71207.1 LysR family transcriptional regulator [Streptacidiphilus sp. P02-A3a]